MAHYQGTFTNKYDQELTSLFKQKESITVTGMTNYTFKNGLLIDASGQTFKRDESAITIDCQDVTTTSNRDTRYVGFQFGAALSNFSISLATAALSLTYKTEMAGIYFLSGLIFLNPSPLKVVHCNEENKERINERKRALVVDFDKKLYMQSLMKKDINFFGLTIKW